MTTPKFKENSRDRARRLDLGKPHLYWSSRLKEWIPMDAGTCAVSYSSAIQWCNDQDKRWRPV